MPAQGEASERFGRTVVVERPRAGGSLLQGDLANRPGLCKEKNGEQCRWVPVADGGCSSSVINTAVLITNTARGRAAQHVPDPLSVCGRSKASP